MIEHQADLWLQSGLRKFHRGISLMLLFLAFFISVVEILPPGWLRAGEPRHTCRRHWCLLPETSCKPPHWLVPMNLPSRWILQFPILGGFLTS